MYKALLTGLFVTLSAVALAAGNHEGGHGHDTHKHGEHKHEGHGHGDHGHGAHDGHNGHHGASAVGEAGKAANVTRTINITMLETDDGEMLFKPATFKVNANETVRLAFVNKGEADHEFVMDDANGIEEHRKEMLAAAENGTHEHHDHHGSNAISLKPGESGDIIWKFSQTGQFQFACLIPGHFEAGMHGVLTVQ